MRKGPWIFLTLVAVLLAAGAVYWLRPRPDPYLAFSDLFLGDLVPKEDSLLLPRREPWSISATGLGPVTFGLSPTGVVQLVGRPRSIDRFGKEWEVAPFVIRVGSNSFRFSDGRLVYAYFQLKEFPEMRIFGNRVANLDRETFKKLPMTPYDEGRQDIRRLLDGKVIITVGFISDGPSPNGKPFYLSMDIPPPEELAKPR